MKLRKRILFAGVFFVIANFAWGQDPVFSQYYAAPLHLNPAFAGVTYAPKISLNYRDQWPTWPNAYRTYAVSYEQGIEEMNAGFGLLLLSDDAGDGIYQTTQFGASFAYQLQLPNDVFLRLGLEAGLIQTRLNWDQLLFGDQLDPIEGATEGLQSEEFEPANLTGTAPDFSAGILAYHRNYYAGLSVKHLNRPEEGLLDVNENLSIGRPLRLSFQAGAEFSVNGGNIRNGEAFISPNVLYMRQGDLAQLNAGAYAGYKSVFAGMWYRHTSNRPDAAILLAGVRYGVLKVGYSYDVTVSGLTNARTGGSHEVSVVINFADSRALQQKRFRSRYSDCFKAFN